MAVHVFTSAAANYLPKIRVLFETVREFRPDWRLHFALADAPPPESARADLPPHELHLLEDLGIPEWRAWTFTHPLIELATGIKPFALRRILARGDTEAAIYLDPDIAVFSQLDEIAAALAEADLALTPHMTAPAATLHEVIADEICTAQHGIYNLGFIGVAGTPAGRAFADWWASRAYHYCREDITNGLYTDQRWIDFVPAFFDRVRVLRSPALNVAPWNLSRRRLGGTLKSGVTVDGEALGFFHFSQVDALPKIAGGGSAVGEQLVAWYRDRTRPTRAEEPAVKQAWAFARFANGQPILAEQRLVFRLRADLQRAFPDPFLSGPATYQAWWAAQAREEFPALFDAGERGVELARLASAVMTGYAPFGVE